MSIIARFCPIKAGSDAGLQMLPLLGLSKLNTDKIHGIVETYAIDTNLGTRRRRALKQGAAHLAIRISINDRFFQ